MADYPYCWPWPVIRLRILERDSYRCQINGPKCVGHATDVDHIIPWDEGGAPWDDANLRAACEICNRGRGKTRTAAMKRLNRQPAPAPSREW